MNFINKTYISMGRICAILLAGILVTGCALGGTAAVYGAVEMKPVGNPDANPPKVTAQSALLYSVDLDEAVYSRKPDKKCDPYSITKLISAVVAAEHADMDKVVTVSQAAADDIEEGTTIDLVPGEKVTIEELMYGALLESGNDAAYALAEGTAGSMKSFVKLMNSTVREWGCSNTHFTNSMGLQDPKHYTTCNDLVIIMKHAMDNKVVRKIMTSRKYRMGATNMSGIRKMASHVTLIQKKKSGVLGGKTGFWEEDDCSVALLYNRNELTSILVLLKDTEEGREKDARKLLKYAHKVTPGFLAGASGDKLDAVWIRHGEKTLVDSTLSEDVRAYPKEKDASAVTTEFKPVKGLEAPLKKGTVVGKYKVYANGELVATRDALLSEDVGTGWFTSYIYISNKAAMGIAAGCALATLAAAVVLLRRRKKNTKDDGKHFAKS